MRIRPAGAHAPRRAFSLKGVTMNSPHCCHLDCTTPPTHTVAHLAPATLDESYDVVDACEAHVGALLPKAPAVVRPLEG